MQPSRTSSILLFPAGFPSAVSTSHSPSQKSMPRYLGDSSHGRDSTTVGACAPAQTAIREKATDCINTHLGLTFFIEVLQFAPMLRNERSKSNGRSMIFSSPGKSMNRKLLFVSVLLVPSPLTARPVTVSDLMAVRTVVDVRISPDGERVAYVLSEPSLEKNEHLATLYIVPSAGGEARRLTHTTRLFNL